MLTNHRFEVCKDNLEKTRWVELPVAPLEEGADLYHIIRKGQVRLDKGGIIHFNKQVSAL
ncbi:MAG: hypothetical protein AAF986_06920 [Pseudomonadota bacterium]